MNRKMAISLQLKREKRVEGESVFEQSLSEIQWSPNSISEHPTRWPIRGVQKSILVFRKKGWDLQISSERRVRVSEGEKNEDDHRGKRQRRACPDQGPAGTARDSLTLNLNHHESDSSLPTTAGADPISSKILFIHRSRQNGLRNGIQFILKNFQGNIRITLRSLRCNSRKCSFLLHRFLNSVPRCKDGNSYHTRRVSSPPHPSYTVT